jgi:(p)ppGpp synthase/HD superfamily hydrolase
MTDRPTNAESLARHVHWTQTDKAGEPYIRHIERVVANLKRRWPDATDDEVRAAWLHDVIEDSHWDSDMLRLSGIPAAVVAIVKEVTRSPRLDYLAWIRDLATNGRISAVRVKLADNEDNSDLIRVAAIPEGRTMLERRYRPARVLLEARLAASDRASGGDA